MVVVFVFSSICFDVSVNYNLYTENADGLRTVFKFYSPSSLKPFHFRQISMSVWSRVRAMKTLTASTPTDLTHVLA